MKSLKWRFSLVAAIVVISIVYLLPSITHTLPPWWKGILPKERLHLGLDLQGGMHLILEVQTDEAVKSAVDRMVDEIKDTFREEGVPFFEILRSDLAKMVVKLPSDAPMDKVVSILHDRFSMLNEQGRETTHEGTALVLALDEREISNIKKLTAQQALETIRNRIDQFGVTEPDIRPQGSNRILVQLPGVKDADRALSIIGKTARLEFKLVDESVSPEDIRNGKLPPGSKVYPMKRLDPTTKKAYKTTIVLRDRTLLTGEYISDARVRIDPQYNTPYVALEFDPQGARIFERITGDHVKERLAIVLDGVVYSAPVIQERIAGGHASITGSFTMEEARDLAVVLRAGALPAPVKILEERTVGPSLGKDSIRMGFIAMFTGGVFVLLLMPLYYKISGIIADVALCLNILLIMAALAAFQATLTLPGIAGIILTIGMSVDANVIIYERVREELRLGKTPKSAISTAYSRATLTVLDANITTLIAAIVLFQFGTGPVRGFAVTLSIGIVASMFTAIFVTRLVFDYLLNTRRVVALSI